MISGDKILLEFIGNNWLCLATALMILNGIARVSKWEWDEKLVNILSEAFSFLRGRISKDKEE